MGRVSFADIEHYGGGGAGNVSYFQLKNDKDVARVRFMFGDKESLDNYTFSVHRIEINGRFKPVSCLRAYNEPVDNCPFCAEYSNVGIKFYIPLYNIDEDEVQLWERGKTFAAKLSGLATRYGSKTPLENHIFEIERNGKTGDMQTTYEIFEVEQDDTTLKDLPEIPEILGTAVLDKSADDMNCYIETGSFPPEDEDGVRRRGDDEEDIMNEPEDDEASTSSRRGASASRQSTNGRRTPSNSNGAGRSNRRAF